MRNDIYLKHLGNKIKELRKSKGMYGEQFAEMCNIDYSNYCRFENGQKDIRICSLKNICEHLGINMTDIL